MGDIATKGNRLTQDQHGGRIKRKPRHPADLRPEQEIRRSPRPQAKRAPTHPDDYRPPQEPRLRRFGGGRTDLLEELGRVEAEPSNRNRRAEISRVHSELNKGYKKGGKVKKDKKWMQKVSASIKKRGTKGKCTPITKPGCTGRAKALAKTFKKIAAKRKAKG